MFKRIALVFFLFVLASHFALASTTGGGAVPYEDSLAKFTGSMVSKVAAGIAAIAFVTLMASMIHRGDWSVLGEKGGLIIVVCGILAAVIPTLNYFFGITAAVV
jgi:hypothetical protein